MRKLRVAARDLMFALRNRVPGTSHYLDTETGEVVPVFSFNRDKVLAEVKSEPDRFFRLAPESSRRGWEIMQAYIATVSRDGLRAELEEAVKGEHAFRRFREVLKVYPSEQTRWHRFRTDSTARPVRERLEKWGVELELVYDSAAESD